MAKKKRTKKKATRKKKTATKKKAKKGKGRKGLWTTAEVNLLKKLFSENPTAMVAKKLGRSVDTAKKKASRLGLKKSKRYLKKIGRA